MRISDWSSDVCSSDLPEELDIAVAVDRIERATTMQVRRIDHRWAGLRTFALDKSTVVGFAPDADGFFWLAGQGGYGVMTAPAMAAAAATLITDVTLPEGFVPAGVTPDALSPDRCPQRVDTQGPAKPPETRPRGRVAALSSSS